PPSSPHYPYTTHFRSRVEFAQRQPFPAAFQFAVEIAKCVQRVQRRVIRDQMRSQLRNHQIITRGQQRIRRKGERNCIRQRPSTRSEEHTSELQSRSDL